MTSSPLSCFDLSPCGDCTTSLRWYLFRRWFSPPYGDCIRMTTPKYPVMELLSPYRDGILSSRFAGCFYAFSPPYGDCTGLHNYIFGKYQLSPPYGDCTQKQRYRRIKQWVIAPLRGLYGCKKGCVRCAVVIAPLTGIVPIDIGPIHGELGYRPPYGDCTLNISQNTAKLKSRMARKYSLYYNDVLLRWKERP